MNANIETGLAREETERLTQLVRPLACVLALGIGWWAQAALDGGTDRLALLAFILAAALFLYGTWNIGIEAAGREQTAVKSTSFRPRLVALALVLAALAFVAAAGNHFTLPGVLAWAASIVCYLYAIPHTWGPASIAQSIRSRLSGEGLHLRWEYVLLGAITLAGAFFRFYRLDGILAEMGPDLPLKYRNVQEILSGNYLVFFPSFPGREALFFYWTAILAALFGNSHLTLKVAAAVVGTVTIPIAFFVARRLFGRSVAIYTAAIFAVSYWHIILSRIGYRAILMPLFVLILAYLIVEALDSRVEGKFALAGLWLGLGLYTYNSFLFAPIAFVVVLLLYWLAHRDRSLVDIVRSIAVAALGAFLVWVPLARYAYDQPQMYSLRVMSRMTGAEQHLPVDLLGTFWSNLVRTFSMFNFHGDSVYVVNVPYLREFGLVIAVLFVLGIVYAVVSWRKGYNSIVLGLFVMMLMPSALALAFPAEVPSSDRASGGIGMALLFAALPLPLIARQFHRSLPVIQGGPWSFKLGKFSGRRARLGVSIRIGVSSLIWAIALLFFILEARTAFNTVFVTYVRMQPAANYSISRELARVLDDYVGNGPAYIEYWPHWFDGNALGVQLTRTTYDQIRFVDDLAKRAPPLPAPGRALFLLHPEDKQALVTLYAAWPRGVAVQHFDGLGNVEFIAFYTERQP